MVRPYRAEIGTEDFYTYGRTKRCPWCRHRFLARGNSVLYCSKECVAEARNKRRAEQRAKDRAHAYVSPYRNCIMCGDRFKFQRSTAKFCSARCRMAAHRAATDA